MSYRPKPVMPDELWKNLWNYSQQKLTESERVQVEETCKSMINAANALDDLNILLGRKELPESILQEFMTTYGQMVGTFKKLIHMSSDPYEFQRNQLKKRNSKDFRKRPRD